jgi:hypothetical protein
MTTGFREQVYTTLFYLVGNAAGFETTTRRVKEYNAVDQATQPALLQMQLGETWNNAEPPQAVGLKAKLFLYCEDNDPGAVLSTQINNLIDAVIAALAPGAGEDHQTLMGLVANVAIAGEVTIAEGLSGQSEATIPLEILYGAT